MVAVIPDKLTFFRGLTPAPQRLAVSVQGERVIITVAPPAAGSEFSWNPSPAGGWKLPARYGTPPPGTTATYAGPAIPPPRVTIPVDFSPTSTAQSHAKLTVMATKDDVARTAIPGFPIDVQLEGNADGVGPGMLSITRINSDPSGPDLMPTGGDVSEFVEVVNVSAQPLDLKGCRLGDFMQRGGRRELFGFPNSLTLQPVSGPAGPTLLRIFTGTGPASDATTINVSLSRSAPVWNNQGDTAWIDNPSRVQVASFSYPTGAPPPPPTLALFATETVFVPASAAFVPTTTTAEEGDRLTFAAFGKININLLDQSEPNGRGEDPAPIGWPADAPPFSLIGRFGATGNPFLIGMGTSMNIRDDAKQGALFLGINDPSPGGFGSGGSYGCIVIQFRPM